MDLLLNSIDQTRAQIAMLRQSGQLQEAEKLCQIALARESAHAGILGEYALIAASAGHAGAALELLAKARSAPALHANIDAIEGLLYILLGRHADAIAPLQAGIKRDPGNADLFSQLANALWKMDCRAEAAVVFAEAAARFPHSATAWNNYGMALHAMGKPLDAVDALKKALEIEPNKALSWCKLAEICEKFSELDQALIYAQKAVELTPENAKFQYRLAHVLNELERPEEAEEPAALAVALDPSHPLMPLVLGVVKLKLKHYDEAIRIFQRVLLNQPLTETAHLSLGLAYLMSGRTDKACDALRTTLALNPTHTGAICYLAHALREAGDHAAADYYEDHDRLVAFGALESIPDIDDREAFHTDLREWVLNHPTKEWEKKENSTYGGYHTGSLLRDGKSIGKRLEAAIRQRVDAHIMHLRETLEPDHPMALGIPDDYLVVLWGTILQQDGYQSAHIHPGAWLSGCYYLSIPPEVTSASSDNTHAGWIEFGEPGYDLPTHFKPKTRAIQPFEGMILLFPSYLFHRTIPFESESQRICLAFDIIPTKTGAAHAG